MVYTYKNRFNKKYGFDKDQPHSLADISKITGYKKSGLETIFNKGIGAFKTNPASVRPQVKSPEQWAQARVYSAVMGGASAKIDAKHLIRK
jgi:alkyl sulfatase BDS1-like metallo-beta-lactamase superfamily hydrolase